MASAKLEQTDYMRVDLGNGRYKRKRVGHAYWQYVSPMPSSLRQPA